MIGDGVVWWMCFKYFVGVLVDDFDVLMYMCLWMFDDDLVDVYFLCDEGQFFEWDGSDWEMVLLEFGVDLNCNFFLYWVLFFMFGMDVGVYLFSEFEFCVVVDVFEV